MAVVCAVDVGTRSARAGLFDLVGRLLGRGEQAITTNEPRPGHAEYSSEDIWGAVCTAVRKAREEAGVAPEEIVALGFDATCSLVVLDQDGHPLPVSIDGNTGWDTLAWFDHRAKGEAAECTATGHPMLDFVGGAMSPEMQTPKAMWLKRHMPRTWQRVGYLFDLPDYLTWRACGNDARSQCTLVSKWPYLAHAEPAWQSDFLDAVGLSDLVERGRFPQRAEPVGASLGPLTPSASEQLGLTPACTVATGLVDAFAGSLGVYGALAESETGNAQLALVAGTSSCVMAFSRKPMIFPGFWGPYFEATLRDFWMTEGGQSATGGLLDHIVRVHSAGGEPTTERHRKIAARIAMLRRDEGVAFASRLHVLPDFHGNRAPSANPEALGVISGLSLDASFDGLCRLYWRACVGIALGVRHILDMMSEKGVRIDTLHATGGHTKNPLLMELYADATGCRLIVPESDEAMLVGTAMVATTAARLFPDLGAACRAMQPRTSIRLPDLGKKQIWDRDYRIFLEMHGQRRSLEAMIGSPMDGGSTTAGRSTLRNA